MERDFRCLSFAKNSSCRSLSSHKDILVYDTERTRSIRQDVGHFLSMTHSPSTLAQTWTLHRQLSRLGMRHRMSTMGPACSVLHPPFH